MPGCRERTIVGRPGRRCLRLGIDAGRVESAAARRVGRYHRGVAHIDDYRFGRISIDGAVYTSDVILLIDHVFSPWWREAGGHLFAVSDLGPVLEAGAAAVVLGTGYYGRVKVPDETYTALRNAGAEVEVAVTGRAVDEYNRRAEAGEKVVAALHLTC